MITAVADLADLRGALLELHKHVLESERADIEDVSGALSAAEFLQIASGGVRLGWLAPLSELIVELDEALVDEETTDETRASLVDAARGLLVPPDPDAPFGRRYLGVLQRSPGAALAHGGVVAVLGRPEPQSA
jgi:hypothetical protein